MKILCWAWWREEVCRGIDEDWPVWLLSKGRRILGVWTDTSPSPAQIQEGLIPVILVQNLFHCEISCKAGHCWRVVLSPVWQDTTSHPDCSSKCPSFQKSTQIQMLCPGLPPLKTLPILLSVCTREERSQGAWNNSDFSKTTPQGIPLAFSPPCPAAAGQLHARSPQQIWAKKRWLLGPWDLRQGSGRSVSFVSLTQSDSFTPRDVCVCVWVVFLPGCWLRSFQAMGLRVFSGRWVSGWGRERFPSLWKKTSREDT